jgi:hypothetical protein
MYIYFIRRAIELFLSARFSPLFIIDLLHVTSFLYCSPLVCLCEEIQSLNLYYIQDCRRVVSLWDITLCIPLKSTDVSDEHIASIFRVEYAKQEIRIKAGVKQSFHASFFAWLILRPWIRRWYAPLKRPVDLQRNTRFISQKIELFITIGVRTSNPAHKIFVYSNQSCIQHMHCFCNNVLMSLWLTTEDKSAELLEPLASWESTWLLLLQLAIAC